jgi:OOP family OmpA-OmpF porin
MKTIHAMRLAGIAGFAGLGAMAANPAMAQESDSYYYGGLGIGQSKAKIDDAQITANLLAGGLTTTGMVDSNHDTAYKIFAGYQFNRNIGLEVGYFDLGKFGFTSTTMPAGTLNGVLRLRGVNLDLIGTIPLGDRFSLFGKVGAQYARTTDSFVGTGAVIALNPNPSARETNYKFGGGLQYAFDRSFILRVEGERYRINDAVGGHGNVNVVSVGLVFPMGRMATPAPRAMAPAPAPAPYVAPPPPPPPPVVMAPAPMPPPPPPPPPVRSRVTFSAESLFGFDKSTLRPEGTAALDKFVAEMSGTRYDMVMVEGHTDRLGSEAYNMKLSEQRADAVKAYLTGPGRLDPAKVSSSGKGETTPMTKPEDCKGKAQTAKLIACLQPDRRVEVVVTGTR